MQSLDRGLEIMEYIIVNRCASVSEIAHQFRINKSTASRILSVLAKHNLVFKAKDSMKYYADVGTLLYSSRTYVEYMILDEIHPLLRALARKIDMTAQICVWKQNRTFLIDQVRCSRYLKEPAFPGMDEPLHCSALGKCILAFLPEEDYQALMKNYIFVKYTENTILDQERFHKEIIAIRQKGYAIDRGELFSNIYCAAVPVYDKEGNIAELYDDLN